MKKNLKEALNLSKSKFWTNHRRFITLGIFLALISVYLRAPFENDFKIKDICGKLNSSYQIKGAEAIDALNLKSIKNFDDRAIANNYCERYLGLR